MPFRFEGFEVWHQARHFSRIAHRATARFPRHEVYALTAQMNRASDAVVLLIAEGTGLETKRLLNHRLALAVGEIFETVAASFLALDRGYMNQEQHAEIYRMGSALARQINRLRWTLHEGSCG